MNSPNFTNFITYRVNGAAIKLLDLKSFQGNIQTKSGTDINYSIKYSKIKSKITLASIITTNKIPENIKPQIKIISGQTYNLKENELWLTLDELNKQKQFVINLVNRRHHSGASPV
jgi:hypothetical protein